MTIRPSWSLRLLHTWHLLRWTMIAISKDATLLTRNLSDFENIANLQVKDWTS